MEDCKIINECSQKQVNEGIEKILKAKNVLHNQILDELEKIIKDNSIMQMKGGERTEFSNKIKILGTIKLPQLNEKQAILDRVEQIQKVKSMTLGEANTYSFNKIKNL